MNQVNLFEPDTKSINDSAIADILVGTHDYRIVEAKPHVKDNHTSLIINLQHLKAKTRHSLFLGITAEGDAGRIARSVSKGIWDATKLQGQPGLDRLPNYADKLITIDAYESKGNNDRVFVNVRKVLPFTGEAVKSDFHQPEDEDDKIDTTPTPAPTKSEDDNPLNDPPATTPAATTTESAPRKKWANRSK